MTKRYRRERIEDLLLEVVSEVFRRMKDPGIPSDGLVSFLSVKISSDLSYATVKYSYLGSDEERDKLQQALDRSGSFFRREINKVVRLRKIPELRFVTDRSLEQGQEILTLLEKVRIEDARRAGDDGSSETPDEASGDETGSSAESLSDT